MSAEVYNAVGVSLEGGARQQNDIIKAAPELQGDYHPRLKIQNANCNGLIDETGLGQRVELHRLRRSALARSATLET